MEAAWEKAGSLLTSLNKLNAPTEKVVLLVQGCLGIIEALGKVGVTVGADDLTPQIIWLVLK